MPIDVAPAPPKGIRVEASFPRRLPFRYSGIVLTIGCLLLVGLLGYVDYRTGYEQSLFLFYLVPIALATWFGGQTLGYVFAILSVIAWIVSDIFSNIPAFEFWNLSMGLVAYAVFTAVLAKLRTLLGELDQRVRERTVALQREIAERERLDREIAEVTNRERQRLGQELHDSICQHLTGTALTAQSLREKLAARSASEVAEADKVVRYIEEGIDLSRNLARGLFPPELEDEGLMIALQHLAENMTARFKIACQFHGNWGVQVRDSGVATQLYRIAQEAVMNAIKHADANRIDISLVETETDVTLSISDDGVGLPQQLPQRGGLGLRLMSHGAGLVGADFQVRRNEGGGTTVLCKVNITNNEAD